jgi:hypothetical protein
MAHRASIRITRVVGDTTVICRVGRGKPSDRVWSRFGGVGSIGYGTYLVNQTTGACAVPMGTLVISFVWR